MDLRRRRWLKGLAAGLVLALGTAQAQLRGNYRTLQWDDLLPPGWDPRSALGGIDLSRIPEGSPEELELQRKMRKIWDNAPVRPELDGLRVRLPGYVVPLEYSTGALREFLLVPYFGACIHTPPPPANQIIQVSSAKRQSLQTMDAVWVVGTLRVARSDTRMGISGYSLQATRIEPYRGPSR